MNIFTNCTVVSGVTGGDRFPNQVKLGKTGRGAPLDKENVPKDTRVYFFKKNFSLEDGHAVLVVPFQLDLVQLCRHCTRRQGLAKGECNKNERN